MHHPCATRLAALLLAAALLPSSGGAATTGAGVPGDPRGDASTWYTFASERFSRTDGATALYESTRRQAGHAPRRPGGSLRAAVADE